jgi:hypothetical protein
LSLIQAAYALDAVAWSRGALRLEPDPWQAEVLRSTSKRILLNCSRQSGKSTVTAILALHTAIFHPGSLILCLSPTLRQSGELFHTVSDFYHQLDGIDPPESESVLRLELTNRSRIVSLPGNGQNVRGYAGVSLLVVDEAARVPDDLYFTIRPMLAVSGGKLIALSTPWGRRGWYYSAWTSHEQWQRWEIPANKCPRISPEFLDEEKRVLGSFWFQQEYLCEFLDSQTQAFRSEDVERAFREEVTAWSL